MSESEAKQDNPSNNDPDKEDDSLDSNTMRILGIVCLLLWVVAAVLLFVNLRNVKTDIVLGNINQSMLKEGKVNEADIKALTDRGPAVVPLLKAELDRPGASGALCVGITVVLGKMTDDESLSLLKECINHPDDQVRPNAVVQLLNRGQEIDLPSMAHGLYTTSSLLGKGQIFKLIVPRMKTETEKMQVIARGLEDKDKDVRFKAFGYLYGLKDNPFKIEDKIMTASAHDHANYGKAIIKWAKAGADLKNTPVFIYSKTESSEKEDGKKTAEAPKKKS